MTRRTRGAEGKLVRVEVFKARGGREFWSRQFEGEGIEWMELVKGQLGQPCPYQPCQLDKGNSLGRGLGH